MSGREVVGERDVLSFVRRRRKEHDRRRASDRLINAYMGLLVAVYIMVAVSRFIDTDIAAHPDRFFDLIAWLPLMLFGVGWAVVRFGTWQGPVLFSAAEMQWVVSAPLSRRRLVLTRLRRALLLAVAAGAIGGILVAAAAAVLIGEARLGVFAAAAIGFAALAALATALSWHVERASTWSIVVERLALLTLVAAGLLVAGAVTGRETAVLWSGPWGWATGPVAAEAGRRVAGWTIQATLLGVGAVAAFLSATAAAERFTEEELWRRAEARSVAAAAMFFGDLRTIKNVARRGRKRGRMPGRRAHMMQPQTPWLTIAARDVLTLRRNPGLVARASLFVAAAFAAAVAAGDRPILGIGAFIGLYAAASRLVEPIRIEADQTDAHRLLPWPWGPVLVMHCLVATVVLTMLGWIGIAAVGVGGLIEPTAIWPMLLVTPFAAAALVTPAAISAARRPFPIELLISQQEQGSFSLILWLVAGPALAAIAINIAFGAMRDTLDQGITGATFGAAGFLATATLAFATWLWTRKPPD